MTRPEPSEPQVAWKLLCKDDRAWLGRLTREVGSIPFLYFGSPEWSWPKGTARLCTSDCDLVPYPSVTAPWAVGLAAQLGGGHHAAVPWASGWADLEHSGF